MIAHIKGTVEQTMDGAVIVDCCGVGYLVNVSPVTMGKLSGQSSVKLYTYQQFREDGVSLFGFTSFEELSMFNRLITVSGIGPKGAMAILSIMNPSELVLAIMTEDDTAISKAPGVGKKTAQRVILDLKDKMKNTDEIYKSTGQELLPATFGAERGDAINALVTLGYPRSDAAKSVSAAAIDGMTTEQILKSALKKLTVF